MPIDRTTIQRGPCVVIFDGATIYSQGDVTIEWGYETFNINTSVHGKADERLLNRFARVSFTPAGEWEDVSKYLPYDNSNVKIGDSIFGNSDKTLVIHGKDTNIVTFAAAAITKMPNVILSATKTVWGQMEFLCIGKNNAAWDSAGSFVAFSSAAFPGDVFALNKVFTIPYTAAWGARLSPWNAISTQDGWEISFDLQTTPITTDSEGTVDHTFSQLVVSARAKLIGITPAQLDAALKWQGVGNAVRGSSMNALGDDLVIQGAASGQPKFTLSKAALKSNGLAWGPATQRVQDCTFVATIPAGGGTLFVATTVTP